MRTTTLLIILVCLTALLAGCNRPTVEPNEPEVPTKDSTAVLPSEAVAVESAEAVTDTLETPETVEPALLILTKESVGEDPPQTSAGEEPASAVESVAANWEEGRITFKSASLHGSPTASGEPFDKDAMTAAHKVLPFGTVVTVTNLFNGKQTTVIVNDRLPLHVSAILDLSPAAAATIDMIDAGIVDGRIEW